MLKKRRLQTEMLCALAVTLIAGGCRTMVYENTQVEWRDGVVYEKGTTNLFTGRVVSRHDPSDPCRVLFLHTFRKGRQHGVQREYWENGNIRTEEHYEDGRPCGRWTHWHENGKRENIWDYQGGKLHGLLRSWDENGDRVFETYFRNGKEHGKSIEYHPNGHKGIETTWRNGQLNGLCRTWYENGRKHKEGHYSDGVPIGIRTHWDTNGNVTCVSVNTNKVPLTGEQSP